MVPRVAPALVVALLVLSGCGSYVADPGPETVTPAPVPTTETAETDIDPERLERSHREGLANRSFFVAPTFTLRYTNGSVAHRRDRFTVAADGRYVWTQRYTGPFPGRSHNATSYWNGSRSVTRRETGNGTVETVRRNRSLVSDPSLSRFLTGVLASMPTRVQQRDGGRTIYGEAADPDYVPMPPRLRRTENVTLVARVEGGVVRRLVVQYEGVTDGQRVAFTFRFTVRGIGETTVDRPAWAGNATG